ncbi:MAG: ankyrin repeat domain-containing protein [Methanomassiliicoccaceae archaeon]|nr:ankyrin repeat domain-containing protein [Methanomassiliicoccaceae archaeon]
MDRNEVDIYKIRNAYFNKSRKEALDVYRTYIEEKKGNEEALNEVAFLAADYADAEALKLLFEAGVSPSVTSNNGRTLLHYVAEQRESRFSSFDPIPLPAGAVAETTELLLENGVSALRKETGRSMTCYHYAAENAVFEMVEVMAAHGVKLNMTCAHGYTGIHKACDSAKIPVSKMEMRKKETETCEKEYEELSNRISKMMSDEEARERYLKGSSCYPPKVRMEYEKSKELVENYFLTVKAFAAGGVDIDEKDEGGNSALDIAVRSGAKKIAAFLSGNLTGSNEEQALTAGGMTLHQAAEKGDAEAIKAIANMGADINGLKEGEKLYSGGLTPLGVAVEYFKCDAAEALLSCGADPAFKDLYGRAAVTYLFSRDIKRNMDEGSFKNKLISKVYGAMADSGLKVDERVNDEGDTLLILACKTRCDWKIGRSSVKGDIIAELLKRKPNLNITNRFGETALMHVCSHDFEIVENFQIEMLEKGADVSVADKNGNTALHYAANGFERSAAKSLCDMLLEFGADAKAVNNSKKTALDIATERNNEPLVKLLLSKM